MLAETMAASRAEKLAVLSAKTWADSMVARKAAWWDLSRVATSVDHLAPRKGTRTADWWADYSEQQMAE